MLWSDVEISWLEGDGGKPVVLPFDPPFGLSGNAFVLGQVAVIALTFLLWFLLFGLTLRWTRPTPIAPAPPAQDFPGEEPPAVVSLLANRWRVTEDAVESTLLDLAARHWLELRQPAADPLQTTVHVLTQPAKATPLNRYEQQVLDRVNSESRGGVVPITALTFRDAAEANRWRHKFESAVIADAASAASAAAGSPNPSSASSTPPRSSLPPQWHCSPPNSLEPDPPLLGPVRLRRSQYDRQPPPRRARYPGRP